MRAANARRPGRLARIMPLLAGIVPFTPALIGCGDPGPPRLPVAGSITLDGKPLASGSVVFAPLDGMTAAVAEVKDGAYRVASSRGPAPGRYQVEVRAESPTGKWVPHPDFPGETIEELRELIPARYNAKTELSVEVRPDGENVFDFALTSREAKTRARR